MAAKIDLAALLKQKLAAERSFASTLAAAATSASAPAATAAPASSATPSPDANGTASSAASPAPAAVVSATSAAGSSSTAPAVPASQPSQPPQPTMRIRGNRFAVLSDPSSAPDAQPAAIAVPAVAPPARTPTAAASAAIPSNGANSAVAAALAVIASTSAATAATPTVASAVASTSAPADADGKTKKRRWGGFVDSVAVTAGAGTTATPTATAANDASASTTAATAAAGTDPAAVKKKTRWSKDTEKAAIPASASSGAAAAASATSAFATAAALMLANNNNAANAAAAAAAMMNSCTTLITPEQMELMKLRLRMAEIQRILQHPTAVLEMCMRPDRSPSPEPEYDEKGKRSNMREPRTRKKLCREHATLVTKAIEIDPSFMCLGLNAMGQPVELEVHGDELWKVTKRRADGWLEKRVPIPEKQFPGYNFKGVLIGARGNNQKRLEQETECKIAVRGIGSRIKNDTKKFPGDDEPLHVFICAPNQEKLEKALLIIARQLVPQDDEERQRQLKQVAILNGTWKPPAPCHMCGEAGHKMAECPNRTSKWTAANVVCTICHEKSHIARDCPQKSTRPAMDALNAEFDSFMEEVTGKKDPNTASSAAAAAAGGGGYGAANGGGGGGGGGGETGVQLYNPATQYMHPPPHHPHAYGGAPVAYHHHPDDPYGRGPLYATPIAYAPPPPHPGFFANDPYAAAGGAPYYPPPAPYPPY